MYGETAAQTPTGVQKIWVRDPSTAEADGHNEKLQLLLQLTVEQTERT